MTQSPLFFAVESLPGIIITSINLTDLSEKNGLECEPVLEVPIFIGDGYNKQQAKLIAIWLSSNRRKILWST